MDEDFEFDANDNNDDDPQWTALTTEQKKELMSAVFRGRGMVLGYSCSHWRTIIA